MAGTGILPRLRGAGTALTIAMAGSCSLEVPQVTAPDIDRVFATPLSIEQTIAGGLQSCHNAVQTTTGDGLLPQMAMLALEGYGTVGNLGINARVGIPRSPISNALGSYPIDGDYLRLALGGRLAANAVTALDRLRATGRTLGTLPQDLRARAFGFFAVGCHQGWLAMAYDSAGIVSPGIAGDSVPPLSGADTVMRAALAMFDAAIAIAMHDSSQGTSGFPLPATWAGGSVLSRDGFVRLVRSMRARFRAGVARNPAERDAVQWQSVIADAENGITSDFMVTVGPTVGWVPGGNVNGGFFRVSPMYYGMADASGGYDAWLALPLDQRDLFLIVTPDRRWPQGNTRTEQQTNSTIPTSFTSRPFLAHRTDSDLTGHAWGKSYYFFNRMDYVRRAGSNGAFPAITKAEMDLLAAEGHLRAGNIAAAAARIDVTRVGRGELPALSGVISSSSEPVPGGTACVPRVPAPPAYTSATCANIWEAMKWEKRMETAFTGYGQWYFDSRGWGDLIEATAVEFPVPFQELSARQKPSYSLGGGLKSSAAKGTYGF